MPYPVKVMYTTEDANAGILLNQLLDLDQSQTSAFEQRDALEQAAGQLIYTVSSVVRMLRDQARLGAGARPASGDEKGPNGSTTEDLGPAQMRVLYALSRRTLKTSEVAKQLSVGVSTMARIVEPLLEGGYVERGMGGDGDNRTVQLSITGAGKDLAQAMRKQFRQALKDYLSPLSEQDLYDMVQTCSHLVSLLPSGREVAQPT